MQQELFKDEILREEPTPTATEDQLISQFLFAKGITSQSDLDLWMTAEGMNQKDLLIRASRFALWLNFCERMFKTKAATLFLKRKSGLDQVIYSILWVKEEELSQELFVRIKEGESTIEALVESLPKTPENINTGRLGPTPMMDLPKTLAEILRVSQEGQLWPPRKAAGGWLLIQHIDLIPAVFNNRERRKICLELGANWLKEQMATQPECHRTEKIIRDT